MPPLGSSWGSGIFPAPFPARPPRTRGSLQIGQKPYPSQGGQVWEARALVDGPGSPWEKVPEYKFSREVSRN